MAVHVDVEGVDEVRRALRQIDKAAADPRRPTQRGLQAIQRGGLSTVPRRSGALAGTIQVRDDSVVAGSPGVRYAGVIHFGWPDHNIAANPFLYRAADAQTDAITEDFADYITETASDAGLGQ